MPTMAEHCCGLALGTNRIIKGMQRKQQDKTRKCGDGEKSERKPPWPGPVMGE